MSKRIIESYKRKLATEEGYITGRHGALLRIALCYPNTHSIGMANLGMHTMYELFNKIPEVSCERVFLPDNSDLKEYLKEKEITEDEERHGEEMVQKLTDLKVKAVETSLEAKENDLMEI